MSGSVLAAPRGQKIFEGRAAESPKALVGLAGDVVTRDLVTAVSPGFVPARFEFCVERSRVGILFGDIKRSEGEVSLIYC